MELFNPKSIKTMHVWLATGIVSRDHSSLTFSHWVNKLRILMECHSKLKTDIKSVPQFSVLKTMGVRAVIPESQAG
jgi:hypothetical protein